jgi:hypothetical protein
VGGSQVRPVINGVLNGGRCALDIFQHFVVPEAKYAISLSVQNFCAPCIGDNPFAIGVPAAINFDDQSARVTAESTK